MKKVMVIGSCGAGKSTFAQKLSAATSIPIVHLDQEYWHADWVETAREEWTHKVRELVKKPTWIMDGNYGGTMDIRLKKADTIIFLYFSTWTCLYRVLKRTFRYYGHTRPDMSLGCRERFSLQFLHYVATFNLTRAKNLLQKLKNIDDTKRVYICRNDQELSMVFDELSGDLYS